MKTYNAAEFHERYGREACEQVARRARISIEYFMHYVYGNRRPKAERAKLLQRASDGRLDPEKLVFSALRTPTKTAPKKRKTTSKAAARSR